MKSRMIFVSFLAVLLTVGFSALIYHNNHNFLGKIDGVQRGLQFGG